MLSGFGDRTLTNGRYSVSIRDLATGSLISAMTEGVVERVSHCASKVDSDGVLSSNGEESSMMVCTGFEIVAALLVDCRSAKAASVVVAMVFCV